MSELGGGRGRGFRGARGGRRGSFYRSGPTSQEGSGSGSTPSNDGGQAKIGTQGYSGDHGDRRHGNGGQGASVRELTKSFLSDDGGLQASTSEVGAQGNTGDDGQTSTSEVGAQGYSGDGDKRGSGGQRASDGKFVKSSWGDKGGTSQGYSGGGGRRGGGGFNKKSWSGGNSRGQKWDDGKGKSYDHRRGGGGRWDNSNSNSKVGSRSGDSENPDGVSKSSEETLSFWADSNAKMLPEVPFEYEPYETNFPQEAADFIQELWDSKCLLRDEKGVPYDDCRGLHTYTEVCQFCDGLQRGPWAKKNGNQTDPAFKRYQDGIIDNQGKRWNTQQAKERREVIRLGTDADEHAFLESSEDFGLFDQNLRIAD